jgi:hypothetical protein
MIIQNGMFTKSLTTKKQLILHFRRLSFFLVLISKFNKIWFLACAYKTGLSNVPCSYPATITE